MPLPPTADSKNVRVATAPGDGAPPTAAPPPRRATTLFISLPKSATMNTFVESCVNTVAGSAVAAERRSRHRPRAARLLKLLANKKNILVTAHQHPDPDALASAQALAYLLDAKLKGATVHTAIRGTIAGGLNGAFTRHANLKLTPWDDQALLDGKYDAIILLDTQPTFAYSPIPAGVSATAVIDHHRTNGRRNPKCPFCDIRTDVGATTSIIFSYFLELQVPIPADLAAGMLYAIETDLAGAAGTPGELDNIALSNLTLVADTHKLYQMRYVDLPQSYYVMTAYGLANALYWDNAIFSHLETIDSLEKPAVIADVLLRFDQVQWSLVTAVHENKLVLSVRTSSPSKISAANMMRRLVRKLGEGGGHRTKAGGVIPLQNATPGEVDRIRTVLRRRYLRALKIKSSRGQRLVPKIA
jgi:nanoRNase/pAp phosphatase (c-di-AMP/oligoRNAs hydrolase)